MEKAQLTQDAARKTDKQVKAALQKNKHQLLIKDQLHSDYLKNSMYKLGKSIFGYDVGHPWLLYYIVNALYLLKSKKHELSAEDVEKVITMLEYCRSDGFAGGHGQYPHLAPTYAAFLCILSLGQKAYGLLDRQKLYSFFKKLKHGRQFRMHQNGQCDLRGIYIVIIIAKMVNMKQDIYEGLADEIISCQTYEGGLTNVAGGQAHGGYTFCGVAALAMLGKLEQLDISRLMFWMANRQVDNLGGFNGRTNKLIDSCYSFWVGAVFNIVDEYFKGKVSFENKLLYDQKGLQRYLVQGCQQHDGGMIDKPGKSRDLYHTMYSLTGLSLSQKNHQLLEDIKDNELATLDPIYNVSSERLEEARKYFQMKKVQ